MIRRGLLLVAAVACAGCERVTDDMARQPRTNFAASSPFFADGQAARPPAPGTVVHAAGDLASLSGGRRGGEQAVPTLAPIDPASIARGEQRYTIYCLPCHGSTGAGDGVVVRRGFPAPPSFATVALRTASDARLHDAIRHGAGAMYPFADRVSVADAWAIVAYVRQLQRKEPS